MRNILTFCLALASSIVAPPAFAQHFSPSNANFTLSGSISVNTNQCLASITGVTGSNVGTSPSDPHWDHATAAVLGPGSLTPNPSLACVAIPFNSAIFVVDSFNPTGGAAGLGSITGSLYGVNLGGSLCVDAGPLPITGENTSLSPDSVRITFSGTVGACVVNMDLDGSGFAFVL